MIEEEADHLAAMIEDLLDASRLQAGGLTPNLSDVSIPTLAEHRRRVSAPRPTVTPSWSTFLTKFPIILADENRVIQVISNLVSNAIKYCPRRRDPHQRAGPPRTGDRHRQRPRSRDRPDRHPIYLRPLLPLRPGCPQNQGRRAGALPRKGGRRSPRWAHVGGPSTRFRCPDLFFPAAFRVKCGKIGCFPELTHPLINRE